jgi:arginase
LREKAEKVGTELVWFDAHANAESLEAMTSGYLDATAASMLMGECWSALLVTVPGYRTRTWNDVVLVSARNMSAAERRKLETEKVKVVNGGREEQDDQYVQELMGHLETGAAGGECVIHIDLSCLDVSLPQ